MSVQVKTPTKTQFERLELGCSETRDVQGDGSKKSKDDSSLNTKFSQPWNRKRRYSQSYRREENAVPLRRKRIKSAYFEKPLPMKFLNGGSIDDPLNLNGLDSSELGKKLNSVTPKSSPLPTPKRQSVKVRIPVNVTDPLNLNESDDSLLKSSKKKRHRHRHKKKDAAPTGCQLFSPPKNVAKDKNLMEALKIDVEPEIHCMASTPKDNVGHQKPRMVCDKIVSPVIRHVTPKHKKRKRTNSDGKPEPSAANSRSLLTSSSLSTTSPKKFKHPKLPSRGKGNKAMQGEQPKFVYGNYNRYYGYRNPALEKDHRMNCFLREWFEGKCVLDIGCNVGHLTLAVAKEFNPFKMIGIDIDHRLITAARKNIRYHISSEAPEANKFPISNVLSYGPIEAPPVRQIGKTSFPHNIMFMQGNYVLEHDGLLDLQKEEYDVIMALSITKWIHFNWGDDGLKRFFKRIFKQLRPGGLFILEPQPWSSYKKKKKLNDTIFQNFQSISLRPEQFNDFLLSREVGFSTCNTVDVPMNKSKGFRRPIVVFKKSETVQNTPLSEHEYVIPMISSESQVFTDNGDKQSEYSSCSTCSCSTCCSEQEEEMAVDPSSKPHVSSNVNEKLTGETLETERMEEVEDCTKEKPTAKAAQRSEMEQVKPEKTSEFIERSQTNYVVTKSQKTSGSITKEPTEKGQGKTEKASERSHANIVVLLSKKTDDPITKEPVVKGQEKIEKTDEKRSHKEDVVTDCLITKGEAERDKVEVEKDYNKVEKSIEIAVTESLNEVDEKLKTNVQETQDTVKNDAVEIDADIEIDKDTNKMDVEEVDRTENDCKSVEN